MKKIMFLLLFVFGINSVYAISPEIEIETNKESYDYENDIIEVKANISNSNNLGEDYELFIQLNDDKALSNSDDLWDKYDDYMKAIINGAGAISFKIGENSKLNKCGKNTIKIFYANVNDITDVKSNVAQYDFDIKSITCTAAPSNPQTDLSTNYIILFLVLSASIAVFLISKKCNKLPKI